LDNLKGAKGRDKTSPRISTSELETQEAKDMGGEARGRDEVGMGDEQFFDTTAVCLNRIGPDCSAVPAQQITVSKHAFMLLLSPSKLFPSC
jgi:hypothetical protein